MVYLPPSSVSVSVCLYLFLSVSLSVSLSPPLSLSLGSKLALQARRSPWKQRKTIIRDGVLLRASPFRELLSRQTPSVCRLKEWGCISKGAYVCVCLIILNY